MVSGLGRRELLAASTLVPELLLSWLRSYDPSLTGLPGSDTSPTAW
jgi:hypothetical protein